MGSNSSTGGGGGGKTEFGYTKPKRKFVPPSIAILKGLTEGVTKMAKESNLKRRKKFISKSGLTGDDINMSDEYLSSKEGLAELKKQGYTTVSDNINDGGGNDNNNNQVVQAPPVATIMPTGTPTEVEISQSEATKAEDPIELRKRKAKAKGRSPTIMTGVTGATGSLTLGKPSLLGS
jgi:hypothetical protein